MGYTTEFEGSVTVEPPLNPQELDYLRKFSKSRRVRRQQGPFYVDGSGDLFGKDIINNNLPPVGQPGLWCDWIPSEDGTQIHWNGTEKFYSSEEWMTYLIDHFLTRPGRHVENTSDHPCHQPDGTPLPAQFAHFTWDHVVNGVIHAQGEDPQDTWRLVVRDNTVTRVEV